MDPGESTENHQKSETDTEFERFLNDKQRFHKLLMGDNDGVSGSNNEINISIISLESNENAENTQ